MITAERFRELIDGVAEAGFGGDLEWSESVQTPASAEEFAREAIFVICNSGMRFTVAQGIYERVLLAIEAGKSAASAFGHEGKTGAIDAIWQQRADLFRSYLAADDKLEFLAGLPWIGPVTKYHLAKNFGVDVAKPDVHLQRLAAHAGVTPQELCARLAAETGYRIATVDVVIWRACAIGLIKTRELQ